MAFNNTTLAETPDLPAGEVLKSLPHAVMAFETFENGLVEGRFCKFDTGRADLLDGSSTPTLAGIVRRKLTGEIGVGVYSTSGAEIDQVAEIITFGWATVTVTDAATPAKYDQVYTVNATGANSGKATDDSGQLIVPGAIFWEEKASKVWLVRVMMGVETSFAYVAALPTLDLAAVNNTDGTATLTIQAIGLNDADYEENVLVRAWVGTANDFGVDAITGITVATGTSKQVVTANGELLVISDATGTIVLTLNNNAAGTLYAWAEIGGNIYPSGAIVITDV